MFDANAAHIPIGEYFFAEVHSTNEALKEKGVKLGDIVLCKHETKSGVRDRTIESTKIWTRRSDTPLTYNDSVGSLKERFSWLVYSGRPDGKGFLASSDGQAWKSKALEFLGGDWVLEGDPV